jgi:FSR family fosmidomycin resistance protein-like MFS transporter
LAQGAAAVQSPVDVAPEPTTDQPFDARRTFTVAGGHLAHDLYSSFIGILIPAVQEKLGISLALVSFMIPAQQVPGIAQPFVGYLADRTTRKWFVVLAPTVTAITISSVAIAPNVVIVMLLLMMSGLSSACFHAPAVALVGELGGKKTGRAMSIFMAFGESARTIGPLLLTAAIALFTLEGSAVVMVFGIAASVILFFTLDTRESDEQRKSAKKVEFRPLLRARRKPLGALLAVSVINGLATSPYQYFLVKYLVSSGRGEWYAGIALSLISAAGIAGGLLAGNLSDVFGRKMVLTVTSLAATPLFYFYLWIENGSWIVLAVLMAAGFVAIGIRPVVLAVAQDLMPEARGATAGLMLAIGFIAQSITAPMFGALGDHIGLNEAFWIVSAISLLALPFIPFLPSHQSLNPAEAS